MTTLNVPTDGLAAKLAERAARERAALSLDGFAVFIPERPPTGNAIGEAVSLLPSGTLSLGIPVHLALNRPHYVQMSWNAETRMAALRPCEPGAPGAYTVNGRAVCVISFVRAHAIDHEETRRYPVQLLDGAALFGPLPEVAE